MNRDEPISAVVFGATGYVGGELLRLLAVHPVFELVAAVSESRAGERIGDVFPHLAACSADRRFRRPRGLAGWH